MEKEQQLVEELVTKAEAYAKTTYEISKLKLLDNSSSIISTVAAQAAAGILLLLSIFMLSIGIGFYLGDLTGRICYGFFIVAAFYIAAATCSYFFLSSRIKRSVSKSLRGLLFE